MRAVSALALSIHMLESDTVCFRFSFGHARVLLGLVGHSGDEWVRPLSFQLRDVAHEPSRWALAEERLCLAGQIWVQ